MSVVIRRIVAALILSVAALQASGLSLEMTKEIFNQGKNYLLDNPMKPDSAVACFQKIIDSYRPELPLKQREICAAAACNLGFTYYQHLYDFKSAYESLLTAQQLCRDIDRPNVRANVYINLGNLYSLFSEHNGSPEFSAEAIEAYREAFMIAYENRLYDLMLYSFCNLTKLGQEVGHIREQSDILDTYASVDIPGTTSLAKYTQLRYVALKAYLDDDKEKATSLLIQSINSVDDTITPFSWYVQALDLTAVMYLDRNMPDSAHFYANRLLEYTEDDLSREVRANAYKILSEIYTRTGDEEKARTAYVNLLMVRDSMRTVHRLDAINNLKFVHDLAAERYNSATRLAEADRQKKVRELIIFFTGLILVVIAPLLIIIINRHRRLQASYRDLFNQRRQIIEQEDANRKLREESLVHCTESDRMSDIHPGALQVLAVLDKSEEIYNPDFSLERLSELTGIRPRTLSGILNNKLHISFRDLLNQYRVREACRKLGDPAIYGHFTIEAISQSVGYKSRTSLISVFKKETGLTPSEYQRQAHRKNI